MAKVKIGEKEFEIDKFNMNDIMEIDEKVGDITKLGQEEKVRDKLKSIRYVLWYAIHKKNEKITETEVGNMITISELNKILEGVMKAADIPKNPIIKPKK